MMFMVESYELFRYNIHHTSHHISHHISHITYHISHIHTSSGGSGEFAFLQFSVNLWKYDNGKKLLQFQLQKKQSFY
jgi:hypothetical protein